MTDHEIDWNGPSFLFKDWETRRDQGIGSSAQHAEQDVPGWGEQALEMVELFAKAKSRQYEDSIIHGPAGMGRFDFAWTAEECRTWATARGLPQPPELRAWGAVTQKAIRQGIIRKTGQYAPAASSNGSPKPLYVGCV